MSILKNRKMSTFTKENTLKYNNQQHPFHLVKPSPWPILLATSLLCSLVYTVLWMHNFDSSQVMFIKWIPFNFFWVLFAFISWLWDVIIEATYEGRHTAAVQRGLRMGFLLFIVSEIMFFFSFFWAFFHSSVSPAIWIGAVWPPIGIQTINAWAIPLLNTVILLTSGVTVTWAHKAMATTQSTFSAKKSSYIAFHSVLFSLLITILLGALFTSIQLYEYKQSTFSINDSVYGSVFYLLTGFHGFHVLIGTIFLAACFFRHVAQHFTRDHHIGFEMAIWYWHFVDVVWIFLFIFVYVWGG